MSTEGRQTFRPDGRPRPRRKSNARVPDRYQQLIDGVITIDDLDEEEIIRGQLRDQNGHFSGHPPRAIPWTLHDALRATMEKRMQRKLMSSLPEVLDSLVRTARYDRSGAARVAAAQLILDRTLGKVPDKAEITTTVTAKWEDAAKGGRIFVDLDADVVDADVVEPEPEATEETTEETTPPPLPRGTVEIEAAPAKAPARPKTGVVI